MKKDYTQLYLQNQGHVHCQDVTDILEERLRYLNSLIESKRKALKSAPAGTLRISERKHKKQYYHRKKKNDRGGVYIPQDQKDLIRRLAQKSYDEKVLREAEKESRLLQKMLLYYKSPAVETIFENLSEGRKELIQPIEKTPEEYVREWSEVSYKGKGFAEDAPELYTDRGERVRSKSELIIANILYKNGIPYRYECPLELKGYGTVYPDFTILNIEKRKEIILEHLGMMDDPAYAEQAVRKVQSYTASGFYLGENLILTAETRQQPLNIKLVQELINKYARS